MAKSPRSSITLTDAELAYVKRKSAQQGKTPKEWALETIRKAQRKGII